jgi:hypothetical protein
MDDATQGAGERLDGSAVGNPLGWPRCGSGDAAFLEELPENLRGVAFLRFARDDFR